MIIHRLKTKAIFLVLAKFVFFGILAITPGLSSVRSTFANQNLGESPTGDDKKIIYRFPGTHNPNPVEGRLYLQPSGVHADQVIMGTVVDLSAGTAAEYNPFFHSADDPSGGIRVNSDIFTLQLSHGFRIKGLKIEAGGIVRSYRDADNSALSVFLVDFHHFAGHPENIPHAGTPYQSNVGENRTAVIGQDGKMYITTVDLFAKLQLFEESTDNFVPNLTMTLSTRIPTTGNGFDTFGAGTTLAASKHITDRILMIGSLSLVYQNLSPSHFNASNITTEKMSADLFGGFVADFGEPGGWYTSFGIRFTPSKIHYAGVSDTYGWGGVAEMALVYQSAKKDWEWYVQFSEGAYNQKRSREPDFLISTGLRWLF